MLPGVGFYVGAGIPKGTRVNTFIECGCCGQYHPAGPLLPRGSANYMNDCRYDANRFNGAEEYTARTGKPAVEVWLNEQEEGYEV